MVVLAVWPSPPAMCHLQEQETVKVGGAKDLRIANHKFEVVVAVDTRAQVLVVVLELFNRHDVVPLVGLPHLHKVGDHLVSGLSATLEIGVEAHIVSHLNVFDGHLATSVLVKHSVGLMDHVSAAIIQVASDGAQKLVEGKLAILVGVEVLHNLGHLNVRKGKAVVTHGVLKLNGAKRAVSVPVHGLEHAAQTSESVGTSLAAKVNHSLLNLLEVADLHMLLHVGVAQVQVTALSPRKADLGLLGIKVDVALVALDSLGLVERLGEATRLGEGVRARGSTHVSVLSLESLGVDGNRSGLRVVTLGNSLSKFIVSGFGSSPCHATLHSEVFVTTIVANQLAVLRLHDFAANGVGSHVSRAEVLGISCIEVTLLVLCLESCLLFGHLLSHLAFDLTLDNLLLAADAGNASCWVRPSAVLGVVSVHEFGAGLSVDSVGRVVELLAVNRVLKVEVALGDMLFRNRPKNNRR